jgi:hypothetical protein
VALSLSLVLAAHLPGARAALPALGLLTGPLGWVLLGIALLAPALAMLEGRVKDRVLTGWTVFAVSAAAYVTLGLWYTSGSRVAGDEPHYLLMAQSLWREGDLDLRDNFQRGDFHEYLPNLDQPHYGAPRADGRPYPAHSPGLPLLLAPAYALGGRAGCVILMALLAAAAVTMGYRLALRLGAAPGPAALAWVACGGPPLLIYAFHLYTEVPSALAVVTSLLVLLGTPGVLGACGAALCAAALPWLHLKMIPAAAALGLVGLWRLRGRARVGFAVCAALAALAFLAYYRTIFGIATPLALYGGGPPQGDVVARPAQALLGLLLDRSFGLLSVAPVFLLALSGLRLVRRKQDWAVLFVAVAILAPVLFWRMWWGGQCPPARLLIPLVPLLLPFLALRLTRSEAGLARCRTGLLAAGYVLAAFALREPARMLWLNRRDRPTRLWDALAGEISLDRYLPSLVYAPQEEWRVTWFWVGGLLLLLIFDIWATTKRRGTSPRPTLPAEP